VGLITLAAANSITQVTSLISRSRRMTEPAVSAPRSGDCIISIQASHLVGAETASRTTVGRGQCSLWVNRALFGQGENPCLSALLR
jgi:hypothetical protein